MARCGVDRGDPLLPELDARLGELAIGDPHRGCVLPAEDDVELREAEREAVVLVDQRDPNLVGERLGETARQLQAGEPGTEDDDVLHAPKPTRVISLPEPSGLGEVDCEPGRTRPCLQQRVGAVGREEQPLACLELDLGSRDE